MNLHELPVRVAPAPTGMAQALLHEISEHLNALADAGTENSIDLRSLPMNEADLDQLREQLGRGEIVVTLNAAGQSELFETSFAGVWWAVHRDEGGAVVAERIEICRVPEIVYAHPDDIAAAKARLTQLVQVEDQDVG